MKVPKLRSNILFSTLQNLLNVLTPLITFPYVLRVIGPEGYGKFNWALSIIAYFIFFANWGVQSYGTREIAKCGADLEKRNRVASLVFFTNTFLSLISTAVFAGVVLSVQGFRSEWELFFLSGISLLLNAFSTDWLFGGIEKYRFTAIRSLIFKILFIVAVFVFVHAAGDYPLYALLTILIVPVSGIVSLLGFRKEIKLSLRLFNVKAAFALLKSSSQFALLDLVTNVYTNLNIAFLGFISGSAEVGYYATAFRLIQLFLVVMAAMTYGVLPRMAAYHQSDSAEEFRSVAFKMFRLMALFALPVTAGSLILGPDLLLLFSGEKFVDAIPVFLTMAPVVLFAGISTNLRHLVFVSRNREKEVLYAAIVGAALCISASLALVSAFGAIGAAVAFVLAEASIAIFLLLRCEKHLRKLVLQAIMGPQMWATLTMTAVLSVFVVFGTRGPLMFFVSFGTGVAVYVLFFLLTSSGRKVLGDLGIVRRRENSGGLG